MITDIAIPDSINLHSIIPLPPAENGLNYSVSDPLFSSDFVHQETRDVNNTHWFYYFPSEKGCPSYQWTVTEREPEPTLRPSHRPPSALLQAREKALDILRWLRNQEIMICGIFFYHMYNIFQGGLCHLAISGFCKLPHLSNWPKLQYKITVKCRFLTP